MPTIAHIEGFTTGASLRTQQAIYVAIVFLLPLLATAPRMRASLASHPRRWVLLLLLLDFGYMLWLTIPFVPLGVDESFYAINAHVYGGNRELWHCWSRPPLASLGALSCPWHPPLIGLLLRSLTAWFAFLLAGRAVPLPWALAVPLLVLVGSQLSLFSAALMSEPYGAACFTAFALVAARGIGGGLAPGLLAGLAFLSRWPLAWLLPVAMFVGYRRQRLRGLAVAVVAFALPVAAVIAATGTKPWLMVADRGEWQKPVLTTLPYFLRPDVAFGIGCSHLVLMLVGAFPAREAALRWSVFLFVACAAALTAMGEATMRLMTPAAPVAAVVAARGMQRLAEWSQRRRPLPALLGGLFVGLVAVSVVFPVRPLRNRMIARESAQNLVREHREELLRHLGTAPLYTDFNFIAITAVLNHRCIAVTATQDGAPQTGRSGHPGGVGLDLDGHCPPCPREQLPRGAFHLTGDPAGHTILWQAAGVFLVRR
jgi:hypothetical protein